MHMHIRTGIHTKKQAEADMKARKHNKRTLHRPVCIFTRINSGTAIKILRILFASVLF
jgi:hypothetical protein